MQCYWESIYPIGKEMLIIRVPTNGGPDMLGAVDLANLVMPEATMICVMNPDGLQTSYQKHGTTWHGQFALEYTAGAFLYSKCTNSDAIVAGATDQRSLRPAMLW
jgi:hypothetical protein